MKKRFLILFVILIFVASGILYIRAQYVLPIIMYHKIDSNAALSKLSVSPESFKRQMSFLKRHNYNVVMLGDLPDLIKKGRVPYKTVAITFDDGYEDNYINAYPVLKELGLSATIFISPALIGKDGYLTWDEVIEMSESNVISIGSHTMTHAYLPDLPEQKLDDPSGSFSDYFSPRGHPEARRAEGSHVILRRFAPQDEQSTYRKNSPTAQLDIEIFDSKRAIESHIRKEVDSFSYPLGGFNDYIKGKVIKGGYKIAVATNIGRHYPKHDLFAMRRLRISRTSDNLFVFWIEVSGFYTWIKEHRDED